MRTVHSTGNLSTDLSTFVQSFKVRERTTYRVYEKQSSMIQMSIKRQKNDILSSVNICVVPHTQILSQDNSQERMHALKSTVQMSLE